MTALNPSVFYIRASWAEMEPSRGQYAWNDVNSGLYKDIQGARQRGMQVAFRVYANVDYDQPQKGSPHWIFYDPDPSVGAAAWDHCTAKPVPPSTNGLEGPCPVADPGVTMAATPDYADDNFRTYFQRFLNDFATALNDPQKVFGGPGAVAYVDASSFGKLGENNSLYVAQYGPQHAKSTPPLYTPSDSDLTQGGAEANSMYKWQNEAFRTAFRLDTATPIRIPLALVQGGMSDNEYKRLMEAGNYMPRMDHAGGSINGPAPEQLKFTKYTGKVPSVAEDQWTPDQQGDNRTTYLTNVMADAVGMRSNMLDLRSDGQDAKWTTYSDAGTTMDSTWFAQNGGYRISVSSLAYPDTVRRNTAVTVDSKWANRGTGMLPSNLKQISGKYRIAYALLDPVDHHQVAVSVDLNTNPADWVNSQTNSVHNTNVKFDVAPGNYELAVGIVNNTNTTNPTPQIKLAIKNSASAPIAVYNPNGTAPTESDARWYQFGKVAVTS